MDCVDMLGRPFKRKAQRGDGQVAVPSVERCSGRQDAASTPPSMQAVSGDWNGRLASSADASSIGHSLTGPPCGSGTAAPRWGPSQHGIPGTIAGGQFPLGAVQDRPNRHRGIGAGSGDRAR